MFFVLRPHRLVCVVCPVFCIACERTLLFISCFFPPIYLLCFSLSWEYKGLKRHQISCVPSVLLFQSEKASCRQHHCFCGNNLLRASSEFKCDQFSVQYISLVTPVRNWCKIGHFGQLILFIVTMCDLNNYLYIYYLYIYLSSHLHIKLQVKIYPKDKMVNSHQHTHAHL